MTPATRKEVCRLYGVAPGDRHVEVDHLISIEFGGANDVQNLWSPPSASALGAGQKDAKVR